MDRVDDMRAIQRKVGPSSTQGRTKPNSNWIEEEGSIRSGMSGEGKSESAILDMNESCKKKTRKSREKKYNKQLWIDSTMEMR